MRDSTHHFLAQMLDELDDWRTLKLQTVLQYHYALLQHGEMGLNVGLLYIDGNLLGGRVQEAQIFP